MRSSRFVAAGLGLALVVLAGCESLSNIATRKKQPPCPGAVIVRDLSRMTVFRPGQGRDITDVVYEARLPRMVVTCTYNDTGVDVETAVTITAARGPADRDRRANVRYFVAVLDGKNQILAKREFESNLQFPPNLDRGGVTEQLVQRIPLKKGETAVDHVIVAGFQLTSNELAFNRKAGSMGLLGTLPPAPERPLIDTGDPDTRPLHERTDDPFGDRPR